MTDTAKPALEGEILPPETNTAPQETAPCDLALPLPPEATDVTLDRALLGQWRYWGAARTINAYRKMVEAGISSVHAQENFLAARSQLEAEQERWAQRDLARDIVKIGIETQHQKSLVQRSAAATALIDSEVLLEQAKDRKEAMELLRIIAANNRETERLRSEVEKEKAQQELEELRGGKPASFNRKLRLLEDAKRNYAEFHAAKEKDIESYGGEDKLPEFLVSMYRQLEADLAFGLEEG